VNNVSCWWPNLRHLGEPLVGAEGLLDLEAVSFKNETESMARGRVMNVRWEWDPDCGSCNTKAMGGKGSVWTRRTDNRLMFAERRERVGVW